MWGLFTWRISGTAGVSLNDICDSWGWLTRDCNTEYTCSYSWSCTLVHSDQSVPSIHSTTQQVHKCLQKSHQSLPMDQSEVSTTRDNIWKMEVFALWFGMMILVLILHFESNGSNEWRLHDGSHFADWNHPYVAGEGTGGVCLTVTMTPPRRHWALILIRRLCALSVSMEQTTHASIRSHCSKNNHPVCTIEDYSLTLFDIILNMIISLAVQSQSNVYGWVQA